MSRKQIDFDLDTKALKEYYDKDKDWHNAYYDIRAFLIENGFMWDQGSQYVSKNHMNTFEIEETLIRLGETFEWINLCLKDISVTNIGAQHSYNHLFHRNHDSNILELNKTYLGFTEEELLSPKKSKEMRMNPKVLEALKRLEKGLDDSKIVKDEDKYNKTVTKKKIKNKER